MTDLLTVYTHLPTFLSTRAGAVLVVLLTMTIIGTIAIAVGFILAWIPRFHHGKGQKLVNYLLFWGVVLTAARMFGMWCAGL